MQYSRRSTARLIRFLTVLSAVMTCGLAASIASNVLLLRGLT